MIPRLSKMPTEADSDLWPQTYGVSTIVSSDMKLPRWGDRFSAVRVEAGFRKRDSPRNVMSCSDQRAVTGLLCDKLSHWSRDRSDTYNGMLP